MDNNYVCGISTGVNPYEEWGDIRLLLKFPWEKAHLHLYGKSMKLNPYVSHFNLYCNLPEVSPKHHKRLVDYVQTKHIKEAEASITKSSKNISTNKTNISKNATDIKVNKQDIKQNADNIDINKENILKNKSQIDINVSDIASNLSRIAVNELNIETNRLNIEDNKSHIDSVEAFLNSDIWEMFDK